MSSSTSALETQLSQQLDSYISAFNRGDFSTAASHYHSPAITISSGSVTVLHSREDVASLLSATVDRLRKDGFDHSEWAGPKKMIVLDDGLVLVSCVCKRLRKDGSSCQEFSATYTLRKMETDGEWLIVAIHQHEVGTQLK